MLEATFGALVSLTANVIYIDKKRKGVRGFGRICAFWLGTPVTWLWLFFLPEGKLREIEPPPDDVEGLLEEIRRDRALREAAGGTAGELPSGDGGGLPPTPDRDS
jgi:hypothetical protein